MGISGLARHLVKEGLLSESDCQLIARDYTHTGAIFAKIVVSLGLMSEEKLAQFLHQKTRLPVISLQQCDASHPELEAILPLRLIQDLEVLPLELRREQLTVAMADPLDQDTLQQLRFFSPYRIRPVIATFSSLYKGLNRLISDFSPGQSSLQKLLTIYGSSAHGMIEHPAVAAEGEGESGQQDQEPSSYDEEDDDLWDESDEGLDLPPAESNDKVTEDDAFLSEDQDEFSPDADMGGEQSLLAESTDEAGIRAEAETESEDDGFLSDSDEYSDVSEESVFSGADAGASDTVDDSERVFDDSSDDFDLLVEEVSGETSSGTVIPEDVAEESQGDLPDQWSEDLMAAVQDEAPHASAVALAEPEDDLSLEGGSETCDVSEEDQGTSVAEFCESDKDLSEDLFAEMSSSDESGLLIDDPLVSPSSRELKDIAELQDESPLSSHEHERRGESCELAVSYLNHALACVSLALDSVRASEALGQGMIQAGICHGVVYRIDGDSVIYVSQWHSQGEVFSVLEDSPPAVAELPVRSSSEDSWELFRDAPASLKQVSAEGLELMTHWSSGRSGELGLTVAAWDVAASGHDGIRSLAANLADRFFRRSA
ncbi:MAG: hypothetical protein H6618_02935 [Deltaproteobacteria bacterium]|nr:hypothetical protein [Deltaproteobacteria bacterium]